MFTTKTPFLKAKAFYRKSLTAQINIHVKKEKRLKVFDQNDVYLSIKKISKNNSMADEMRADNEARQDWNCTADPALVVGVPEDKGLEIKLKIRVNISFANTGGYWAYSVPSCRKHWYFQRQGKKSERSKNGGRRAESQRSQRQNFPHGTGTGLQAFMAAYNKAERIVKQYEWVLAERKQQAEGKSAEEKKPPERRSVVAQLYRIRDEAQKPPKRSSCARENDKTTDSNTAAFGGAHI